MSLRIAVDKARIADFCRRHRIRRLALFGSVLREDFGPTSDVDVLVEFEPGAFVGYGIVDMEDELSAMLGRRVDLVTARALNHRIRPRVLAEAQTQYAAASPAVDIEVVRDRLAEAGVRPAEVKRAVRWARGRKTH
jgi:hypothetical protein